MRKVNRYLKMASRFIFSIFIFVPFAFRVFAAPTSLELSEKYSRDLQERLQAHLNQIYGQGKSQMFVTVDVGFSKEMQEDFRKVLKAFLAWQMQAMAESQKVRSEEGEGSEAITSSPGNSKTAPSSSQYPDPSAPDSSAPPYILPGYVLKRMMTLSEYQPYRENSAANPAPASSEKKVEEKSKPTMNPVLPFYDTAFLYSIGSEIKRVVIKVVLDESLPSEAEIKVQTLIAGVIELDPARGDQVVINRMLLVPTKPREILISGASKLFGDPQFLGPLLQWTVLGGVLFLALILASLVLRNLSLDINLSSLPSWLGAALSVVHQGSAQQSMQGMAVATSSIPSVGQEIHPRLSGTVTQTGTSTAEYGGIDIPAEKTGELYNLVGHADPGRIALIAARLRPDVSAEFLKRFDPEKLSQIVGAMANPQYIDPAILNRLKEEVEKRVQGLVGGEDEILKVLGLPDQKARMRILTAIEAGNPGLYRQIRSKVLLIEDLEHFEGSELALVLQRIPVEDLSLIIRDSEVPQNIKDKILRCLAKRTAEVVIERSQLSEQPMSDQASQIQGKLLLTAEKMIQQGLIRAPGTQEEAEGAAARA